MNRTSPLPHLSISQLKREFREGRTLTAHELTGFYPGLPAGPWWFRLSSGPTLSLTGFGGWRGKLFLGKGHAINLFQTHQSTEKRFPMTLARKPSRVDGKDTLVLLYPTDARAPWCWVTDELRRTADGSILGMTFVDLPLIRHLVFPFVLKRQEN